MRLTKRFCNSEHAAILENLIALEHILALRRLIVARLLWQRGDDGYGKDLFDEVVLAFEDRGLAKEIRDHMRMAEGEDLYPWRG